MNHLSTSMIAAVATAALLGAAAPAAVAGPHANKAPHAAKADRDAVKTERKGAKVSKMETRIDRALNRLADSRKIAKLDEANLTAVRTNIVADVALEGVRLRPATYRQVINQVDFAERLLVAAAEAGNTEAATAVDATVDTLVTFTAATEKSQLRVTKRELQVVAALLEDETEETEETEETPVEDAPVEETPVEETPTEEPAAEEPDTTV